MSGWIAGIVIACAVMAAVPPTARLGDLGWTVGGGIQAASLVGWLVLRARPRWATFGVLLAVTWLLPLGLAAMQWLGGGWDAPYHELYLPALILGSAGLPVRRFVPFAIATALLTLAPARYAPDRDQLVGMLAELAVWAFVVGALSVLMERIRGQARLARSDPLTELGNRRALEERFEASRGGPVVLAVGDLDGFKRVNDRHGHLAGDTCLAAVGRSLAHHVRAGDQVFRCGGDEFAVVLPGIDAAAAEPILRRLESAVAADVRDPDGAPVRISFGWAGGHGRSDLRTLTAHADAALLRRKAASAAA